MTTALAAQELVARRRAGRTGERLAEKVRPSNLEQALAIQAAVTELLCADEKDTIGAWKAGLPSGKNPDKPDRLVVAPIFASSVQTAATVSLFPSGASAASAGVARVEPEFAFFLARDLPARKRPYSAVEIRAAVGSVHMALELVGGRYSKPADCTFSDKLADSLENQGLLIGPSVVREHAFNASELTLTLTTKSGTQTLKGKHPAGDPAAPLYWLAEFLRSRGEGLRRGQAVVTGCYSEQVLELPFDQPISVGYTSADGKHQFGQIDVQFKSRG
ncbi:MAG: hydratase [Pseudomonadota bacterium]